METKRIASQLRRSYEGIAWHGRSLRELLDGMTAERAAAKPIPDAHSVWELVLHVEAWERMALTTLEGQPFESMTGDSDWPPVRETTAEAWQTALERLQSTTSKLIETIRSMEEAKLDEIVAGKEFNHYFLLHGVVQHNLYHAGQIAVLRKL
ncbi:MAG TPA: DinB family protein [Bryobacteraceae bacterium]